MHVWDFGSVLHKLASCETIFHATLTDWRKSGYSTISVPSDHISSDKIATYLSYRLEEAHHTYLVAYVGVRISGHHADRITISGQSHLVLQTLAFWLYV